MSGQLTVTFRADVATEDEARALVDTAGSEARSAFNRQLNSISELTLVSFEPDRGSERTLHLTDDEERLVQETLRRFRAGQ